MNLIVEDTAEELKVVATGRKGEGEQSDVYFHHKHSPVMLLKTIISCLF